MHDRTGRVWTMWGGWVQIEDVLISKLCSEVRLVPDLFHRWQEQLFLNATARAVGDTCAKCLPANSMRNAGCIRKLARNDRLAIVLGRGNGRDLNV